MASERRKKPEERRHRFGEDDTDLAIAVRWNSDPFTVRHVWPLELWQRALNHMRAEADGG